MVKYITTFNLSNSVANSKMGEANQYLQEDNMTKYLIADLKYYKHDKSEIDKIIDIEWRLDSPNRGRIVLMSSFDLSEDTLAKVSEWVKGQNSDGLGEGFEQQDWGEIEPMYGCPIGDEEEDEYIDDYSYQEMYSFDWYTNNYIFAKE